MVTAPMNGGRAARRLRVMLVLAPLVGCVDARPLQPDGGAAVASGADANRTAEPEDAPPHAPGLDSSLPSVSDVTVDGAVPSDGGADDGSQPETGLDAGAPDARTASCDLAACPRPDSPLHLAHGADVDLDVVEPFACCVGEPDAGQWSSIGEPGSCGLLAHSYFNLEQYVECHQYMDGAPDGFCLDTIVDGDLKQGCCRPDGRCGHLDPGWGCHLLHTERWWWGGQRCGERPPEQVPNPFVCLDWGEPCQVHAQCCYHGNYGAECSQYFEDGPPTCNLGMYE